MVSASASSVVGSPTLRAVVHPFTVISHGLSVPTKARHSLHSTGLVAVGQAPEGLGEPEGDAQGTIKLGALWRAQPTPPTNQDRLWKGEDAVAVCC